MRSAPILGIKAHKVNAQLLVKRLFVLAFPDNPCQFEHHGNPTCSIVGSENRLSPVRTVRVVVGPRTAIPMRTKQYSRRRLGVNARHDVTTAQLCTVISRERCSLRGHLTAIFLELTDNPFATKVMPPTVHVAWPEVALCLCKGVSTIGIERRPHWIYLRNLLGFLDILHLAIRIFVVMKSAYSQCSHSNSKRYFH